MKIKVIFMVNMIKVHSQGDIMSSRIIMDTDFALSGMGEGIRLDAEPDVVEAIRQEAEEMLGVCVSVQWLPKMTCEGVAVRGAPRVAHFFFPDKVPHFDASVQFFKGIADRMRATREADAQRLHSTR